jgi:hypothetical protein
MKALQLKHLSKSIGSLLFSLCILICCASASAHDVTSDSLKIHKTNKDSVTSLNKTGLVTVTLHSGKDTTTISLKADSLFTLLNKALIKKDDVKSWLDEGVEGSEKASKFGENIKNIIALIAAAVVGIGAWLRKKSVKPEGGFAWYDILIIICAAVAVCIVIYYLAILLGTLVMAVLRLIGYAILIAPIYWLVYTQYLKVKTETNHTSDTLTKREIHFGNEMRTVSALIASSEGSFKVRFYLNNAFMTLRYVDATLENMDITLLGNDPSLGTMLHEQLQSWFIEICNHRNFN